eukprot:757758-Hanusia_phi.AAC.4
MTKRKGGLYFCEPVLALCIRANLHELICLKVDPEELDLPDYFDIIERPMDFGTIQLKLSSQNWIEDGLYERSASQLPPHKQIDEDVQLVFSNAMLYNPAESDVHQCASSLLAYWKQQFAKIESEEGTSQSSAAENGQESKDTLASPQQVEGRGCGVGSPGDGVGTPSNTVLAQRHITQFFVISANGKVMSPEEHSTEPSSFLVGVLQRPGLESQAKEEAKRVAVPIKEIFLQYFPELNQKACLWIRGAFAWYKLDEPMNAYRETFQKALVRVKTGDLLKGLLLKSTKAAYDRTISAVLKKAESFMIPPGSSGSKQRFKEKQLRSLLMNDAAYLSLCVDDLIDMNPKAKLWKILKGMDDEASDLHGAELFEKYKEQHEVKLEEGEMMQVCTAVSSMCFQTELNDLREKKRSFQQESFIDKEIKCTLESVIGKVVDLNALPTGTPMYEDLDFEVVNLCRIVLNFYETFSSVLFQSTEMPSTVLPIKLIEGMRSEMPSSLVERLHIGLISLLVESHVPRQSYSTVVNSATWPEHLRIIMEDILLRRAQAIMQERRENGETITLKSMDDSAADDRSDGDGNSDDAQTAADYEGYEEPADSKLCLQFCSSILKEEMEIVDYLGKYSYTTMPVLMRWRALNWLCSTVSELEGSTIRDEIERRITSSKLLERLQGLQDMKQVEQQTPDMRMLLFALNVVLVEDARYYGWFSCPVEPDRTGLKDYFNVIKVPMDLGTVVNKILANEYESHGFALRDIRQVWANARLYHGKGAPVTKAADHLETTFEDCLKAARSGSIDWTGRLV